MPTDTSKPTAVAVLPLLRYSAAAVAAARVVLGVVALTRPSLPARPWVGASADELGADVFGRALGARDLALGLGALAAAAAAAAAVPAAPAAAAGTAAAPGPAGLAAGPARLGSASAWYAAGALSDACDVAITVAAWPRLPKFTRWLVAASAGGAAIVGAAGAVAAFRR
jgi:hypothetical protein